MTERSSDELNTAQRLIVAEQLAREALTENERLDRANAKLALDFAAVSVERDSLRGVVQAATELVRSAQGSHLFGGAWDPGIVSVRDLAAALGIEPNGPPPPPTEAELQEMRDMLAEVRSDRALAAAADAPQTEAAAPTPEAGCPVCHVRTGCVHTDRLLAAIAALPDEPQEMCPQGQTDYEACYAPFRYCPVKGCNRPHLAGPGPSPAVLPEKEQQ